MKKQEEVSAVQIIMPNYVIEPLPTLGLDYFLLYTHNPGSNFVTIFSKEKLKEFETAILSYTDLSNEDHRNMIESRVRSIKELANTTKLLETIDDVIELVRNFELPKDFQPLLQFEICNDINCKTKNIHGRIIMPTPKKFQIIFRNKTPEQMVVEEGIPSFSEGFDICLLEQGFSGPELIYVLKQMIDMGLPPRIEKKKKNLQN